jgi:hypothetical protein
MQGKQNGAREYEKVRGHAKPSQDGLRLRNKGLVGSARYQTNGKAAYPIPDAVSRLMIVFMGNYCLYRSLG